MKTQIILIILLIASMLLLGCTQEQPISIDTNNQIPSDTNLSTEDKLIEQEMIEGWINENEVVDVGSVI
jgi:PBP1b-binding outer membrane lipoprotein LpoB